MVQNKAHQELVHNVLLAIGSKPYVRVWKQNTGVGATANGKRLHFGLPGAADITGILRHVSGVGLRLEIECKTGSGKLSEKQLNFKNMIDKMGGLYLVCRSVQEAIEFVEGRRNAAIIGSALYSRVFNIEY